MLCEALLLSDVIWFQVILFVFLELKITFINTA